MIFAVEMRKYFKDPETESGTCTSIVYWLYTIFTRSDAAATIYFIVRVCTAFIRELHLLIPVAAIEIILRETVD